MVADSLPAGVCFSLMLLLLGQVGSTWMPQPLLRSFAWPVLTSSQHHTHPRTCSHS
jgi:hypothetical protein